MATKTDAARQPEDQVTVRVESTGLDGEEIAEDVYLAEPVPQGAEDADRAAHPYADYVTVPASTLSRWREAEAVLRTHQQALEEARRVWEREQDAWRSAVADYIERAGAEIEAEGDRQREEQERKDTARQIAEEAERQAQQAAIEAAADAEHGPRIFTVRERTPSSSGKGTLTVHVSGCAKSRTGFARTGYGAVRAHEVMEHIESGATFCGTCRVEKRLRAVSAEVADRLDMIAERLRHKRRPLQARKATTLMGKVASRLYVAPDGGGSHGWSARDYRTEMRVTWNSPGIGEMTFPDNTVEALVKALIGGGYHTELVASKRSQRLHSDDRVYREIRVTRMSEAEEALATRTGIDLLWVALGVGMSTVEALVHAQNGNLSTESIATLAALQGED